MAWHIKPGGSLGKCTAKPGNCKYGEDVPHFKTLEDGLKYLDEMFYDEMISSNAYYPMQLFKSFEQERWNSLEKLSNTELEDLFNMINDKHPISSQRIFAPLQINYAKGDSLKSKIHLALNEYSSVRDSIDTQKIKRAMLNYFPEKTIDDTLVYSPTSSAAKKILKDEFIDDFVSRESIFSIEAARETSYESLDNAVASAKDANYLMLFREQQLRKLLEEKEYYGSSFVREKYEEFKVVQKNDRTKNVWILHNGIVEKVFEIKGNNLVTEKMSEIPISSKEYSLFYDDSKEG